MTYDPTTHYGLQDFDFAPLTVTVHGHSMLEWEIEDALVSYIAETYPRLKVHRQWRGYPGLIPDLITVHQLGHYTALTIIEIKRFPATRADFNQLSQYVRAASRYQPKDQTIFGVLATPGRVSVQPRPDWFAHWELVIRRRRDDG